ncbi:MAG: ABC transporter permease subunit [Planctomycetes bacterium]|nr:ABC transporter permease subunit [Planctomycetota bacterium]
MNNPVLAREFRLTLRNSSLQKKVIGAWAFLALIIILLWPESGVISSSDQASRLIFKVFSLGQLFFAILVAPAITAPLITDEKEKDRFAMLFASLLGPWDVLLGKWMSSFCYQIIALLTGLPFMVLTLALGGVSWLEVMQVYLVCLLALLQFGLLGLFFSCMKDKTYDALLNSYAWMLVLAAATWLPGYLMSSFDFLVLPFALLRSLSPFSAMMDIVSPEVLIYLGTLPSEWRLFELWSPDYLAYVVLSLLTSLLLFYICLKRVFDLPLGRDRRSQVTEVEAKKKKFPYILINPDKRRKPFSVSALIFIKELRCKMFSYMGNLIRGIYLGLFVSISLVMLVALNVGTLSFDAVRVVSVSFQAVIILLMTPALTSSAVSEEVSSGTLDMLRMTPVTAWKFWLGKMMAGIFYMMILLVASSPIYLLVGGIEVVMQRDPMVIVNIVVIQAFLLILSAAFGIWCSAVTRNTQKAVGFTYLILFLLTSVPFSFSLFIEQGVLLDWLSSMSSLKVSIMQMSEERYYNSSDMIRHLVVVGGIVLMLLSHSLFVVHRTMRQAA